jgi:hypothetical protein
MQVTAGMTSYTTMAESVLLLILGEKPVIIVVRVPSWRSDQRTAPIHNFGERCQTTEDAVENEALNFGHSIGSGIDVVCMALKMCVCVLIGSFIPGLVLAQSLS